MLHDGNYGQNPFKKLCNKAFGILSRDIDIKFRSSENYAKLLSAYYKAPYEKVMSSLLAQSSVILNRYIFL